MQNKDIKKEFVGKDLWVFCIFFWGGGKNPSLHIDGRGFVGKSYGCILGRSWGRMHFEEESLIGSFPMWSRIATYSGERKLNPHVRKDL